MKKKARKPPEWLINIAMTVNDLVCDKVIRQKFEQMTKAWAKSRQKLWGKAAKNVSKMRNEIPENGDYPSEEERHVQIDLHEHPKVFGPPPLCLGNPLTIEAKYAALAAIFNRLIKHVSERSGESQLPIAPWNINRIWDKNLPQMKHIMSFAVLESSVTKLKPKHSKLISSFVAEIASQVTPHSESLPGRKKSDQTGEILATGRKKSKLVTQRAEFAHQHRHKDEPLAYSAIYEKYRKKYPKDSGASRDTIRLAYGRRDTGSTDK